MADGKKHDYPNEILEIFREGNYGHSKDSIARKIGGDRNQVFEEIQKLIDGGLLFEKKRKLWVDFDSVTLFASTMDAFERKLSLHEAMIFGDKERDGLLKEIKKRLKSSTKPMFYAEEVIIDGKKFEGEMHQINPEVKSHLQAIREQIDSLVRSAYAMYGMHTMNPVVTQLPVEQDEDRFRELQEKAFKIQIQTRHKLMKMCPKENQYMYNEWDFMVFSGFLFSEKNYDPKKLKDSITNQPD